MLKIELGQAATSKGSMAEGRKEEGGYPFAAKRTLPLLPSPLSIIIRQNSPRGRKSSF